MAVVISLREMLYRLRPLRGQIQALERQLVDMRRTQEAMEGEGQSAESVDTTIQALIDSWDSSLSSVLLELSNIPATFQVRVKPGMPAAYWNAVVDASDPINSGYGTIRVATAQETTVAPFSGTSPILVAGDRVVITNAENPLNNSAFTLRYTPQALSTVNRVGTDFTSTWAGGAGDWTLATTTATHVTGNTTPLTFPYSSMTSVADNTPYLCTFTVSGNGAAKNLTVRFDATNNSRVISGNGTYECIVYSESGGNLTFLPASDFVGVISAVTLTPWTGLAFTGGLNADSAADETITVALEDH